MLGHTTQLASDTIFEDVELFQIDQFAELLGQFACKASEHVSKSTTHV